MKSLSSLVLILIMGLIFNPAFADLPPGVTRCKKDESFCMPKKIVEAMLGNPKGNPKFGLPPLDKVTLTNVVLSDSNNNGPVNLQFTFKKCDIYGFENATFDQITGNEEDLDKLIYELHGEIPRVVIKGEYETHGKILLLPINGEGHSEMILKNGKFVMKVKLGSKVKNGKRYAVIKNIKEQVNPEHVEVKLQNLFNGNKELEDTMNQLVNENWKDIWNELRDGINKAVENLSLNLIKDILNVISYDDLMYKEE